MKRVVIVGGGIAGLAAAHRLVERTQAEGKRIDLSLLEASGRIGGIIQTRERDGFLLESGPDSFISEKPEALKLTRRLGLEPHLIQTNEQHRRSFVVRRGRLLPVPEGFHLLAPARFWPFVTSDIFSWVGKARMAMDLLLPRGNAAKHHDDPRSKRALNGDVHRNAGDDPFTDESLAQFVRRRLGR